MIKRSFDFVAAAIGLVVFLPLILLISLLVKIKLGSPIFFIQSRPGLDGKVFKIVKFRTMLSTRDAFGNILSDKERMSRFGSILRSTSLDELPGLINVLKGDMSLVGPRPLLVEYLPLYDSKQAKRHNVRPGVTGWAQINGRNAISWEDKFKLDVWYVENQTLMLDIKILLLTLKKVFFRDGITGHGEVTMSHFKGNDNK
ncbi:MAG: sugar transferase [Glaciecola sp.]|jgi:lipopolysaccharide/colanic/teichoic acid biosynthesis glycosyltransferase